MFRTIIHNVLADNGECRAIMLKIVFSLLLVAISLQTMLWLAETMIMQMQIAEITAQALNPYGVPDHVLDDGHVPFR